MAEVEERLQALIPFISEISQISGTPGASIGVLHEGEVVFTHNYGCRDVEDKVPPDENAIYHLASLSKSYTVAALGILTEEGNLSWDDKVKNILPDFRHLDDTIYQNATVIDSLSHRTGLGIKNRLWLHEMNQTSLSQRETLSVISYLEPVSYFRSRWLYNNWGYALAALIIARLSGQSWGDFLTRRILEPLALKRSRTRHGTEHKNVAEAYMALSAMVRLRRALLVFRAALAIY